MPGRIQPQVKPRIYTTRRGLDAVKHRGRPASVYDQPPSPAPQNEGFTPGINTDVIDARLSPGEYVLPNWLVQDIQTGRPPFPGQMPPEMMRGGEVPGYQFGGQPISQSAFTRDTARRALSPLPTSSLNPHLAEHPSRSGAAGQPARRAPGAYQTPATAPSRPAQPSAPVSTAAPESAADRQWKATAGREPGVRAGRWQRPQVGTRTQSLAQREPQYTGEGLWRGPSPGPDPYAGTDTSRLTGLGFDPVLTKFLGLGPKEADERSDYERGLEEDLARRNEAEAQGQNVQGAPPRIESSAPQGLLHRAGESEDARKKQQEEDDQRAAAEGRAEHLGGLGSDSETETHTVYDEATGQWFEPGTHQELTTLRTNLTTPEDRAEAKRIADEAAEAAEAAKVAEDIAAKEADAAEHDAASDAFIDRALSEPVPQWEEEDYAKEEAEIDRASRKALGDAMRMAGEQASAMGMPMGAAQGVQAQVTADVSAKHALAKAQRFAQMRVQNMQGLMTQYDNKHKSLLMAAGLERDRAKSDEIYAQALDMQNRGKDIQKELLDYQDMLNTPSFWEGMLQIVGGVGGIATGAAIMKWCWVAEELFGEDDRRTHMARLWASTNDTPFTREYRKHGQGWAKWLKANEWAKPLVQPTWERMARMGEEMAILYRAAMAG